LTATKLWAAQKGLLKAHPKNSILCLKPTYLYKKEFPMGLTLCRVLALSIAFFTAPAMAQTADAPKDLRILRITPAGDDVDATRQIVVEFNRPVVPVGRMDRMNDEVGITIFPTVKCQWRWLNTSSLSCNLSEADQLQTSTAYNLTVTPKIEAEDGAKIAEDFTHRFITSRANAEHAYIHTWLAPGKPQMPVSFNQPVTKQSVQEHLYFEQAQNGKARIAINVFPDVNDRQAPIMKNGDEARTTWVVEPISNLPLDTKIILKQEAGLVSAHGDEISTRVSDLREFQTFPELALKGISCRDKDGNEVLIAPNTSQPADKLCNPLQPVHVVFTAPVLRSQVKDNLTFTPDLAGGRTDYNPWGDENRDYSRLWDNRTDSNTTYTVNLPFGLKAAQKYTVSLDSRKLTLWERIKVLFGKPVAAESKLKDEFGRALPPFTLSFATGHRNPNYELIHRDAVLEKNVDSEVPLYVNNLDSYEFKYRRLTKDGASDDSTGTVSVPNVQDVQFAVPADVRGMLKGQTGALYGHLTTAPDVKKWDNANRLFAQVTPYQVYTKLGHFQSSVWVTDLASGDVVPNAKVTIFTGKLSALGQDTDDLATAITDKNGLAVLPGTNTLDPNMTLSRTWRDEDRRLFVRVDKGDDMALLPIAYEYEVQLWNVAQDVYTSTNEQYGHMKAWGMTAQGIYRAGDTMQYKIYVRDQDNNRLILPPQGKYTIDITDPAGKSVQRIEDVKLTSFGTVSGEYTIPKNAAVGWYNVNLEAVLSVAGKDVTRNFYPLSVLVSDFTPAPFRVGSEINGTHFKAGDKININADAKLHSGGAYGEAAVRSTITLRSRAFISKDERAKSYRFDSFEGEMDSEQIFQKEDKLNDKGEWATSFTLPEKQIVYGQLIVENAVRDERGKSIANEVRADYAGVDRLVGLKPEEWVFSSGKSSIVKAIVVDDKGTPQSGTSIDLVFEKENVSTAKVKSAGSAYLNDNTVTWDEISSCKITSKEEGQDCTFTPETAGTYRVTASIKDTKGRTHTTQQTLWVAGKDYVQWNEGREYALTILPERNDYKVGDTARYLVKNPYPGAKAYISVERYGVIDSFVQTLDDGTPVIEFPVKPDYVPGFYLSVVVVSPRVEAPPVEKGQIDLGKPAFRVGYVKVPVSDPYKEISVTAQTDAEIYRPRDTVKVTLNVKPKNAPAVNEPFELAVAVLDESVFDLIGEGRKAFDPYQGFYDLDAIDVSNYSLLTRLIGRQKFEKKGANAGGDGGIDASTRNLFKFVSYWNPSVPVDAQGNATLEFEAPDNLTGWRILAIATTPNDLMGLGEANFKVNRPTELRPVMPNQVREGDKFSAGFSVMNRSDSPRTINVSITAAGHIKDGTTTTKQETVTLEPYKRTTLYMSVEAAMLPIDRDLPEGAISFTAQAGDDIDRDGLDHSIVVHKSRAIETSATFATTTENEASENIAVPADIYSDTGAISVALSPSVIANLDGAFRYMRDYPYPCWEQRLSVAAMASHYKGLNNYLSVEWNSAQNLPQDILNSAAEYQAPNGGMAYFRASDEYADPYLSAYTALVFQWMKKAGYDVPPSVESKLQTYLLNFLRNKAAPNYYQDGMTSTVRAVILAALKDSGKITKDDILRFRKSAPQMSLFGKAHYMTAAQNFDETKPIARDVLDMILNSGVESGGKISFNETYDDGYQRILSTPVRDNCAVMEALLSSPSQSLVGDKPFKIVRFITQARGNRDHWENTQENMFCMNALIEYAKVFESDAPDMSVTASLPGKEAKQVLFNDVKNPPVTLSYPLDEKDVGAQTTLSLKREGTGRLYYSTRLQYAPKKPQDNINAGMDLRREYSLFKDGKWSLVKDTATIQRGDLVKVDLYLSVPTARNFVVVNDPLPGGLETVNRDLATASAVDAGHAQFDEAGGSYWYKLSDWREYNVSRWSFYHKELRHDSVRFYADWLEPGNYHLSYTAQAIAGGTFSIPATHAEEMYDPDVYGKAAAAELIVDETP
jgi:uncharacterized protein YfaS (alpha-2-macroglobulin family)